MDTMKQKAIKGYELKEKIGAGAFGAVYRAYQNTVGREVAVKIILPALANQTDFIRRFEGEAQLVARLEHPHITPLYDYWRDPDGAYLVMRWLRGGSLQDALKTGKFELRAAALLLDQIAGALSLAHRNGIIHRDIKPANILLDEDGNAYLTDFGIAKDLNIQGNHTQPDVIVGTLDYISPEQARSELVTNKTDIYSLGVTLFEMITGHHPFENMSSVERLFKHINDPLPDIAGLDSAIAASVNLVIQKATAKNPEQRFADALAFAADFREAIGLNRASTTVLELLTQREHEILALIIDGLSNKEIAQKLTITHGTVKWYVNQIYEKLGVRSRVQAIVRARELHLLTKGNGAFEALQVATEDFHPENPYKGLRAFQSADNQDFFGREKLTAKLLKRMAEKVDFGRFLAVVGPSGSGKSSLVKAGLIPALWRGELPASEKWYIVEFTPASHPIDELEIALTKLAANQAGNLHEHLSRDEQGLVRAANLILPNDGTELVLVIDQFEEVFTLSDNEAERKHFLDLLYAAVTAAKSRIRVIVTLRADFYDRPLHYPDFGEMLKSRLETILPLSAEELEAAIRKPAERVGAVFEAGLVASMVADMNYQAGALPLLQYALTELFEHRKGRLLSREAYDAMGKSTGALAKRADDIYEAFDAVGKAAAKQVFLRLVTVTEGAEDTRRRASRMELLALGEDAEVIEDVIDAYSGYRLLTLDNDPISRAPTVELAHEAILREWERLRNWLTESRDELRVQHQLSAMTQEWADSKREKSFLARGSRLERFEKWAEDSTMLLTAIEREFLSKSIENRDAEAQKEAEQQARENVLKQRSQRFLQALVAVLTLASLLSGGLAVFAFNREGEAQEARRESERSADETRSLALTFGAQERSINGQPDEALLLAYEATNIDEPSALAVNAFFDIAGTSWIERRFTAHHGRVVAARFLPDGHHIISTSASGSAMIWNRATGEILKSFQTDNVSGLAALDVHPETHRAAITTWDESKLLLWDYEEDSLQELSLESSRIGFPRFSPDGRELFTIERNTGMVSVWDMQSQTVSRSFQAQESVSTMKLSSDGQYLVIGGDASITVWEAATGELIQTFVPATQASDIMIFFGATFIDGTEELLLGDTDGRIWRWNWRSNTIVWELTVLDPADGFAHIQDIAISPDGKQFAIAGYSIKPEIRTQIYDLATQQLIRSYLGHAARARNIDFSPDGQYLVTASDDGSAIVWPTVSPNTRYALQADADGFIANHPNRPIVAFVEDFDFIGYSDPWLLDSSTGEILHRLEGSGADIGGILFSPDGRLLLGTEKGDLDSVLVWDWESGELLVSMDVNLSQISSMKFSPNTELLGLAIYSGQISLYNAQTWESLGVLEYQGRILEFSPDGHFLYIGNRDGLVVKWSLESSAVIQEYPHLGGETASIDTNSDGSRLLASNWEDVVVWDTASGEELLRIPGDAYEAEFSPDDSLIMTVRSTGLVVLWDAETGERLQQYSDIANPQHITATFSYDGRSILAGVNNRLVIWDVIVPEQGLTAWIDANRFMPDFTCEQRSLYRIQPLCDS